MLLITSSSFDNLDSLVGTELGLLVGEVGWDDGCEVGLEGFELGCVDGCEDG